MIRFDSHRQVLDLTPCGRVPGTPLPGKHEIVANALVRGMTNYEAGVEANYRRGPGLAGNISRLRHTPEMQERMAAFKPLFEMAKRGLLKTKIEKSYSIDEAKEAVAHAMRDKRTGKIVFQFAA